MAALVVRSREAQLLALLCCTAALKIVGKWKDNCLSYVLKYSSSGGVCPGSFVCMDVVLGLLRTGCAGDWRRHKTRGHF